MKIILLWSISKLPVYCADPNLRKYLILVKLVIKLMSVYSFIDLKEPGVGSPETLALRLSALIWSDLARQPPVFSCSVVLFVKWLK